jgi:WD40 repeat protein
VLTRAGQVTGSHDRSIKVWDLLSGYCARTLYSNSGVNAVCATTDGSLYVSGHIDGHVRVWAADKGELAADLGEVHANQITSVVSSPGARGEQRPTRGLTRGADGACVLTNSRDHLLKMIDVRTMQVVRVFRCVLPSRVYVSGLTDSTVAMRSGTASTGARRASGPQLSHRSLLWCALTSTLSTCAVRMAGLWLDHRPMAVWWCGMPTAAKSSRFSNDTSACPTLVPMSWRAGSRNTTGVYSHLSCIGAKRWHALGTRLACSLRRATATRWCCCGNRGRRIIDPSEFGQSRSLASEYTSPKGQSSDANRYRSIIIAKSHLWRSNNCFVFFRHLFGI